MSRHSVLRYLFATPQRRDDALNLRAWFAFYVVYLAVLCFMSNWGYLRYADTQVPWAWAVWLLGLYMFYFSLACTYIPFPTVPAILFLASPVGGLTALGPVWRVVAVAGLGSLATAVSHTNEYHVLSYLLRLGKVHRIKETRVYLWAERYFKIWPFMLLVVFNVIPFPADPARWLAILSRYSRRRYFLSQWIGRFIRYAAMAAAAASLKFNVFQILLITVLLILLSLVGVLVQRTRQRPVQDPRPT